MGYGLNLEGLGSITKLADLETKMVHTIILGTYLSG